MTRITVQGIGVVGGFGTGVDALLQALRTGRSPRSVLTVPSGTGPVDLSAFRADTTLLKDFVPARALRRMDQFSRLGLLAAHLALADAGLASTGNDGSGHDGLGIIVASGFGPTTTIYSLLDSVINDGDACTSPTHFANSLHNSCSANISINLGAPGPNLTVSQFDMSVPSALLTARQWLLDGRVDRVLFGAVDELSELIAYLWYRKRGLPSPDPMRPLRTGAETAIPGEGAAFLVLSRLDETRPGYCTLEGVSTGRGLDRRRDVYPDRNSAPSGLLVVGADGRRELGAGYAAVAEACRIACYTPHYGSMPAAAAFDMAAAALMFRNGEVFPTPSGADCDFPARVAADGPLDCDRIVLFTLAEEECYGRVELGSIDPIIPL